MFRRNLDTRTIMVQDDSVKNPFNADNFVKLMNQAINLVDVTYDGPGPANIYANSLINDPKRYNNFNELIDEFSEQCLYLCGALKQRGLPVTLPDAQSFLTKFDEINNLYDGPVFTQAILNEVKALEISFMTSIQQNIRTAQLNNVPLKKPEPKKTK